MEAHFRAKYPKSPEDSDGVYRSVIRAKALDTLRGLLPAATTSNVGLFGTGQAFEALLLRMFAHPLEEVRDCAQQMLAELRQVIPAFLARVDQPDRGGRWIEYLADTRRAFEAAARPFVDGVDPEPRDEVTLTDFDPDGEIKVVAAALYAASRFPTISCSPSRAGCPPTSAPALLRAYCRRSRANRRHKPGRAFERTQLPLRRPRRLRRVPRSPAPSPADARLAAAQRRATATSSRRRSKKPARSPTGAR